LLPETLHDTHRQPFNVRNLLGGYWALGSNPRFLMLALASGIPFNGMFLYVLSAPVFLGESLGLGPGEFFWFFLLTIAGIMAGAFLSGRMAGKVKTSHQIRYGFLIMGSMSIANLVLNLLFVPEAWWALIPLALYSFGWAMMVPVVTLLVLDLVPERRGMASSLQAFVGSAANGVVAGVVAPLVMHSPRALASTSLAFMAVGVVAWLWIKPHLRLPALAPQSAA
jgi:DHA1 family bicyclomycin/chloramphenicol resistance-like MFS transporter